MATKAGKQSSIETEEMENEEFSLPNEVVRVQFVKRQRGSIDNPKHILYGGMIEGAGKEFVPKKSRETFKYIPILTPEEQKHLEELMGYDKGGLGLYKAENNYWDTVKFMVPKEGMNLHLNDPVDYIRFKILLTYKNTVAPSLADLKAKDLLTYFFVLVREGESDNADVVAYNVKKEAYAIATKLETSPSSIKEFLYLYGIRVSSDTSVSWLVAKLGKIVEEEPEKLVEIYTTKDYRIRGLIARGVLSGVIKDTNGAYHLEDGIALCGENESPSLANAIKFLANPNNSDVKNRIEAKIGK